MELWGYLESTNEFHQKVADGFSWEFVDKIISHGEIGKHSECLPGSLEYWKSAMRSEHWVPRGTEAVMAKNVLRL